MELLLDGGLALRSFTQSDGVLLHQVISASREAFDPWLRWSAEITSPEAAQAFIAAATDRERKGSGFHLALWRGGELQGGVPCWSIDPTHRVAELGYWLVPGARGRGMASRATLAVMRLLFAEMGVHRIEFQCRVENAPSRRVAECVGGQYEGIRRGSHLVGGTFRDHAVYAILADDPGPSR